MWTLLLSRRLHTLWCKTRELNAEESVHKKTLRSVWRSFVHRQQVNAKEGKLFHTSECEQLENKLRFFQIRLRSSHEKNPSINYFVRRVSVISVLIRNMLNPLRIVSRLSTVSFMFKFTVSTLPSSQVPKQRSSPPLLVCGLVQVIAKLRSVSAHSVAWCVLLVLVACLHLAFFASASVMVLSL